MTTRRCPTKHRTLWIIGDSLAWCYCCGAIRSLKPVGPGKVAYDEPRWTYPTGEHGENPAVVEYRKRIRPTVTTGSVGY